MEIKTYTVDAFTEDLFGGNPAAVCLLDHWIADELMQNIALENNLSETAFLVKKDDLYEIRWFTPTMEVDLCGHATLASAFVLFEFYKVNENQINFFSQRSGELKVFKESSKLFLDFPTDKLNKVDSFTEIENGIGITPIEVYKGKTDYIAILETEEDIRKIKPNLSEISKLNARGLIVTAKGNNVDFVSRFFAPQSGVNEDPVTGSAHTSLTPIWSKKLERKELNALQLSKRGGTLICRNETERTYIGGQARLYLEGIIKV